MNNIKPYIGQPLNFGHWSTDSLVGHWPLVEAGKIVDFSFGGNNGTNVGAVWEGKHLHSDGTASGVLDRNIILSGDFTITLRSQRTTDVSGNNNGFIFGNTIDGDDYFFFQQGSKFEIQVNGVTPGAWADLTDFTTLTTYTLVRRGSTLFLYLDGVQNVNTKTLATSNSMTIKSLIGGFSGNTFPYEGNIEYVLFYNRALSASEIMQLYVNPDLPVHQFRPELRIFEAVTPTGIPILRRRRECA